MVARLDHLVVLVRDLDGAVRDYGDLGFAVTPGGEHADGLSRNALVPFDDGTYLELVSFLDPEGTEDNVWGWRSFLPSGGLIDYCAASDDLASYAHGLEERGFAVEGPGEGGRRLPDGTEIRWRVARIRQDGRLLPFLIEDLTPRDLRVPGGDAALHPNGATGISRLEVAAPDVGEAAGSLAAMTGGSGGAGSGFRLGAYDISPVASLGGRPGPSAVEISTNAPGRSASAGVLDRRLAHGAAIRLVARG